METACHLTVTRSDVTSSGGFSTTRRWAGVTDGGDVPYWDQELYGLWEMSRLSLTTDHPGDHPAV